MKRLEDSLKDHFDHFQPEVDPAVWQQLSQQIPGGTSLPAGKGMVRALSGKAGWIAAGTAAVLTAGIILYKTFESNNASITHSHPPAQEQFIEKATDSNKGIQAPFRVPTTLEETTSEPIEGEEPKTNPIANQDPSTATEGHNHTNDKTAGQTALTGQTGPENGGATAAPPAPAETQKGSSRTGHVIVSPPITPTEQKGKEDQQTPIPVLILSSNRGFAPLSITFMTSEAGIDADFDFGDGHASYGKASTTHRYEEPGEYEVTCTINHLILKSKVTVTGRIPSAFSPNGDGVNDRFGIDNPDRSPLELRIFSRSGQLVFSGKGADAAWDGRLPSGDPAPEGTYLVHILAPSFEGAIQQQKATIQLFR